MLSKFIKEGDKIEITPVDKTVDENGNVIKKVYYSKVQNVINDDTMEITMPMEQTKLILLPVDTEYNFVIYGSSGVYQCFATITDRYKSNNIYMLVVEMDSNLRKYQRREFFRFSCALEMHSRSLEENEVKAVETNTPFKLQPGLPLKRSVIVDISGGGLRFLSTERYEIGSLLYISYVLSSDGVRKRYELTGKVLSIKDSNNRPGVYEHRVEYFNMNPDVREEIIRFIFDEERKERRKQNG